MSDEVVTIVSALIGAIIGSMGTTVLSYFYSKRTATRQIQEKIVQQYLPQFQDSIGSLWFRLLNITKRGGRYVMEGQYFQTSTLYALACVLAYKRILLQDGVYSQMREIYGKIDDDIKDNLHKIEKIIDHMGYELNAHFFNYDRLALAETVMKDWDGRTKVSSYLEFKTKFNNLPEFAAMEPAVNFISLIKTDDGYEKVQQELRNIMQILESIAGLVEHSTGVSSIIEKEIHRPNS